MYGLLNNKGLRLYWNLDFRKQFKLEKFKWYFLKRKSSILH